MSNDILVPGNNGQLAIPDYLRGADFGVTQNLLEGMFQGGNRIGLRNSRFRLVVGGVEEGIIQENYLDTIILGAAPGVSRVFYSGNYDPNENQPPACYSADGIVPAEDVKTKQADKCMTCPQNVKGSKIADGKQYKACSYFRRVVVMLAGDTQDRRVFKLDVKSQGLFGENTANEKNLNDYIKMVATRGVDLGAVVTRISFDLDASVPKLVFKAHRFVDPEEMYAVQDLVQSEEVINLKHVSMATLDMSAEETGAEADQHPQEAAPQTQQAPAQQRPAPQQAPRQQAQRAAAPAPAPAPQRQTTVQIDKDVPPPTRQAPQQAQRAPRQAPQQATQRPAAAQQAARPAPAPAPVQEAMTDDDLGALLDSLE
jgi:uncharacterized protein (DUF4415 family)